MLARSVHGLAHSHNKERMNECNYEWMNKWSIEWMNDWMNECMTKWLKKEWKHVCFTKAFLVACYKTLHPALSVRPSVGWSVTLLLFLWILFSVTCYATLHHTLSVGRSVGWSHFNFLYLLFFDRTATDKVKRLPMQ